MPEIDVAYRLYRLRRLIAVTTLPPALVALAAFPGALGWLLAIASVLAMTAHAIRFPNAWDDGIVAATTLSAAWILLAALGAVTGPVGFLLGVPFVAAALAVLYIQLAVRLGEWMMRGEVRPVRFKASRRSTLEPADLAPGITLWPGRADLRTQTGEADADGVFPVSIGHRMPSLFAADDDFEVAFRARVDFSDERRHVVTVLDETGAPMSTTCHTFQPVRGGCRVTMEEDGAPLTPLARLGFWLQDFGADHLTDEIDRAEGRSERAVRFATRDTLMTMAAGRLMGRGAAGEA